MHVCGIYRIHLPINNKKGVANFPSTKSPPTKTQVTCCSRVDRVHVAPQKVEIYYRCCFFWWFWVEKKVQRPRTQRIQRQSIGNWPGSNSLKNGKSVFFLVGGGAGRLGVKSLSTLKCSYQKKSDLRLQIIFATNHQFWTWDEHDIMHFTTSHGITI